MEDRHRDIEAYNAVENASNHEIEVVEGFSAAARLYAEVEATEPALELLVLKLLRASRKSEADH